MSNLPMKQEDHPAHNLPDPTESYSGDEYDEEQQQGASAVAAQATQDRNDRVANKYQNLYQRSNASSLKAYQQNTKSP